MVPEATYLFKHALIRDAAYEALLKSRRKDLHRLVARTIDEQFTALKEAHPEVLARHWTEAGETEPAIAQWLDRRARPPRRATRLRKRWRVTSRRWRCSTCCPNRPSVTVRELELRRSVSDMAYVTKGNAAPEMIDYNERACGAGREERQPHATGRFSQLREPSAAFGSGDLPAAGALADQALELALREGNPQTRVWPRALQMSTRHRRGDLAGVEQHFAAGLKFFDDPGVRQIPGLAVSAFGFASLNAWMLGRADVARERDGAADGSREREQPVQRWRSQGAWPRNSGFT